jgi:hypothetical protein
MLVATAAAGTFLGWAPASRGRSAGWQLEVDFGELGDGNGWPGWACVGAANLHCAAGRGVLEAGSDVFPCDPRPVAFAVDRRYQDGLVEAVFAATGAGSGVVARRVGVRDYYAAVYDAEQSALLLLRRSPEGVAELGRLEVPNASDEVRVALAVTGRGPTHLTATFTADNVPLTVSVVDSTPALQHAGDGGVLATARTLYPSQGPQVLPALGNLHLLPYGTQQGQDFMKTPAGQALLDDIRRQSTAVLTRIAIRAHDGPQLTAPSVVAASSGRPLGGGASLRVASDVPADIEIEIAPDRSFRHGTRVPAGAADAFHAAFADVQRLPAGRRVYWRAHLTRGTHRTVGPTRSFRVLPAAGSGAPVRLALGACASQFGPIFNHLADVTPDVFIWQGDLNYPDTVGPLAQTVPGYAGIWRDFLANPLVAPMLNRTMFAVQRDDHDYGVQDANSTNLVPWGLAPWEGIMERAPYYRFSAGAADVWVLDQRRHKSDPKMPDGQTKTLLGLEQRAWLLRTLAASRARFKIICSPCTLAGVGANSSDGSWAAKFTFERDLLLRHIRDHVSGRTIFVTGDTHWTMVYEGNGLFEARPCPLGIPTPNDITLVSPNAASDARRQPGVLYADDQKGHFALIDVAAGGLDLALVREDGAVPFRRQFSAM